MKKEEYRSILRRLPIENPTPQDMAALCPHLSQEKAVEILMRPESHIACPPLRVRSSFQALSYRKRWIERSSNGPIFHPPRLCWSYALRTDKSYLSDKSRGDLFPIYKYMDGAMTFAEQNWDSELVLDSWDDYATIFIQDPTDLNKYGHPRTKAVLAYTTSRGLNTINNDRSKPMSELLDEAIVEMTLDPLVASELKGGRGGFTHFNCAHCGHGLGLSDCGGCGNEFNDDHIRTGIDAPLSRKVVALLREKGHRFMIDPEIAWEMERLQWERNREKAN